MSFADTGVQILVQPFHPPRENLHSHSRAYLQSRNLLVRRSSFEAGAEG